MARSLKILSGIFCCFHGTSLFKNSVIAINHILLSLAFQVLPNSVVIFPKLFPNCFIFCLSQTKSQTKSFTASSLLSFYSQHQHYSSLSQSTVEIWPFMKPQLIIPFESTYLNPIQLFSLSRLSLKNCIVWHSLISVGRMCVVPTVKFVVF